MSASDGTNVVKVGLIFIARNVHASRLLPPVIGFVHDVAHLSGIFLFFWLEKQKLEKVSQL